MSEEIADRRAAVESRLRQIVAESTKLPPEKLGLDADLEKLGLNSADLMEVVINVEEAFDIQVPDTELSKFLTFQAAVEYVAERAKRIP